LRMPSIATIFLIVFSDLFSFLFPAYYMFRPLWAVVLVRLHNCEVYWFLFLFLAIPPLSVFCMYEVDPIFFTLLHFYNIKIKLKLITMY
jgi:hypothetical protein